MNHWSLYSSVVIAGKDSVFENFLNKKNYNKNNSNLVSLLDTVNLVKVFIRVPIFVTLWKTIMFMFFKRFMKYKN